MWKDHSQVPVARAGGLREIFLGASKSWQPCKCVVQEWVGRMLLRMHMAAGHFNPLELHSSPSTSGRKEPNTLEDLLKTILVV